MTYIMRWEEIKRSDKLKQNLILRDFIIRGVREWFYKQGFVEVETPALVGLPGMEPYLDPFKTTLFNESGKSFDAYLITSPEYAMKKLLASGFSKIFQICKSFRNGEPFGGLHNPEFTMLEWYRARATYFDLMRDTEKLIVKLISMFDPARNQKFYPERSRRAKINPSTSLGLTPSKVEWAKNQKYILKFKNLQIDCSLPWERLSVKRAFKKFCNLSLDKLLTLSTISGAAQKRGYKIEPGFRYEDVFFKIFLNEIESRLGKEKPVFLYDYPIQLGALARVKKTDPRYAERFELYIAGVEIANAFSELTAADEQRQRLKEELALRKKLSYTNKLRDKHIYNIDEDFLSALGAMPESAGIALGLDRLVMILLDAKSIEEVISFPASSMFQFRV